MNNKTNWHAVYANKALTPWTPESWKAYCEDGPDVDAQRQYRQSREPYLALKHLQLSPGDKILEAGCGYGRITKHILATGATVVGCDISPTMVKFCKQRFHGFRSFSGAQADISKLPFPNNTFSKILCSGVLMHVNDYEEVISELSRVLQIGGKLVISLNSILCPFIHMTLLQILFLRFARKILYGTSSPDGLKWMPHFPTSVVKFLKKNILPLLH